ncbi:MAG: shikimate dehydrogenase [Chloroflexota bacterium]
MTTRAWPAELLPPPVLGHTRVVGVIGWPVEHSVSPPMHNAALRALGLEWCYLPFPVRPEGLAEALRGARALGVRGLNVTVPHKQASLALMDALTPAARAIGAVNTVSFEDDRALGHNTDAEGFLSALAAVGCDPRGCDALVLGAGGAARAVVYALAGAGARLTLLNRTPERAAALAAELAPGAAVAPLDAASLRRYSPGAALVVNTTPLGMWPHAEGTPWPAEVAFPGGALCYDLVYNPRETRLMRLARTAGAAASDGLGMLVHQGAAALRLWTGLAPPVAAMFAACTHVLGGS